MVLCNKEKFKKKVWELEYKEIEHAKMDRAVAEANYYSELVCSDILLVQNGVLGNIHQNVHQVYDNSDNINIGINHMGGQNTVDPFEQNGRWYRKSWDRRRNLITPWKRYDEHWPILLTELSSTSQINVLQVRYFRVRYLELSLYILRKIDFLRGKIISGLQFNSDLTLFVVLFRLSCNLKVIRRKKRIYEEGILLYVQISRFK